MSSTHNFHRSFSRPLAILVVAVPLIASCVQSGGRASSGEPSSPETYQYKGKADPFMSVPGSERADSLKERFKKIQGRE